MKKIITDITPSVFQDYYDAICNQLMDMREQEAFEKAKEDKLIEEAVLIMHPKHKSIIVSSELSKATILWSSSVEEDKVYMVLDEQMKENIRGEKWELR